MVDNATTAVIDRIHGKSFVAIQIATEELKKRGHGPLGYRISVYRHGEVIVVEFLDQNQPPGTIGSVGKPGFIVELHPEDLHIIKSYFIR